MRQYLTALQQVHCLQLLRLLLLLRLLKAALGPGAGRL